MCKLQPESILCEEAFAVSISIAPVVKRPRVFLGVSYFVEDHTVKEWFESTLRVCGFEVVTAETSEHIELGEKIRRKIESCEVSCFVLTRRDKIEGNEEWFPPSWIQGEIGLAFANRQKIAIFVEEKVVVKGMIPHVEDYTHFSRARLDQDTPVILASILSLRHPSLQGAIEILLNQNRLAPLVVLSALRSMMSKVADLRRMKAAIPTCQVVSLIQDRNPILILGAGSADGVLNGSIWMINQMRRLDKNIAETPLGNVTVFHVQPKLAQAKFVDWSEEKKLKDSIAEYAPDGSLRKYENLSAKAQDPEFLPTSTVADIDNFVKVIDQLLPLVQEQVKQH